MKTIGLVNNNTQRELVSKYAKENNIALQTIGELDLSKSSQGRLINALVSSLDTSDTLIVADMSTFSKTLTSTIFTLDKLIKNGVKVYSIKENITIDPQGTNEASKAVLNILSAFNNLERTYIDTRNKQAIEAKRNPQTKTIYDRYKKRIMDLHKLGLPTEMILREHLSAVVPEANLQTLKQFIANNKK